MSIENFLEDEIQKELENQRQFKAKQDAEKAAEEIQRDRARSKALQFRELVERTHVLLIPIVNQFIERANRSLKKGRFKLSAEKPLAKDSFHRYKILKKEKTGIRIWGIINTSIDYDVVDLHFGYNFYDKLFVVRMEGAGTDINNYDTNDVLAADFTERFAQELVRKSGHYMRSTADYLD